MRVGNKSSDIKVSVLPLKTTSDKTDSFGKEKHIIQIEV